ncbi:MAG TPA: redoxin domain-containing protein [Longimicrobiales bacterium]|nr:redoxin domain-containing protein [Longimicrobiales bacterium]
MNWRRAIAGMAVALPVVALLAYGMTRDPNAIPMTMPGKVAPVFALPVMDATPPDTVRLADHHGSVVVLNFWASWCLECRVEHGDLSQVAMMLAAKGVRFYGVLYKDEPSNARVWIREQGGQAYPTLLDPGSRVAVDYALYGVPETVIIDGDGTVVHKQIGPISAARLSEIIEPLLARQQAATAPAGSQ